MHCLSFAVDGISKSPRELYKLVIITVAQGLKGSIVTTIEATKTEIAFKTEHK
jgi:hypothetical protein